MKLARQQPWLDDKLKKMLTEIKPLASAVDDAISGIWGNLIHVLDTELIAELENLDKIEIE